MHTTLLYKFLYSEANIFLLIKLCIINCNFGYLVRVLWRVIDDTGLLGAMKWHEKEKDYEASYE